MLPHGNYVRNPVNDQCIRMLPRGRSVRAQKERAAVYLLPDGYVLCATCAEMDKKLVVTIR